MARYDPATSIVSSGNATQLEYFGCHILHDSGEVNRGGLTHDHASSLAHDSTDLINIEHETGSMRARVVLFTIT